MFNHFAVVIVEHLMGRKLAAVLDELSGTSERTWRKRLKQGWQPSDDEHKQVSERMDAALAKNLVRIGKWSADEARAILAGAPSSKAGTVMPTADLIYYFSPRYGAYCQETIALAEQFDRQCEWLSVAVRSRNVDAVREVLTAMLDWLCTFCPDGTDIEDAAAMRTEFGSGTGIETLLETAKPLHEALLFHVLSCWDVEFCAGYFEGTMQAHPLFQLVMPRFAPNIAIEPETGRLLRDGRQPLRHIFDTATSRLLDFLSVLIEAQCRRRFPDNVPRVKDFAAWSNENEARMVSWRDETTRFKASDLERIWTEALEPDNQGIYTAVPSPMFVCAHLWSPFLVRENKRATHLFDCAASYLGWWERNRDRLIARGLRFGEQAWPTCLTDQLVDSESFASLCSTQSSGRSSSPRDCQ